MLLETLKINPAWAKTNKRNGWHAGGNTVEDAPAGGDGSRHANADGNKKQQSSREGSQEDGCQLAPRVGRVDGGI